MRDHVVIPTYFGEDPSSAQGTQQGGGLRLDSAPGSSLTMTPIIDEPREMVRVVLFRLHETSRSITRRPKLSPGATGFR